MTKINDIDVIKNRIEEDGIKAPESLSGPSMLAKIRAEENRGKQESRPADAAQKNDDHRILNFQWKRGLVLAACLLLAVGLIQIAKTTIRQSSHSDSKKTAKAVNADGFELMSFDSERELRHYIAKIDKAEFDLFPILPKNEDIAETMDKEQMDAPASESEAAGEQAGAAGETAGGSHSETYKQVEGVDEADIIKTDGRYIYYVNGYDEIDIYRANDGKAKGVATISRFNEDGDISEIYLYDDMLVAVGSAYEGNGEHSVVTSYDIADPEKPKKIGEFRQDGSIVATRLTRGIVYLVTEKYASRKDCIPYATSDGSFRKIDIQDIFAFPDASETNYVIASSVDITSGEKMTSVSKAILGASQDIYCNTKNLYIASLDYTTESGATKLIRAGLNNGELKFTAAGKVRGHIIGQFAMDESDGYFRIATTANKNGHDVNNLYVLNSKLEEVGSVKGFARNESIKAVRFIGDRAYVITYEQIDPLFVLDLSDPQDPAIDGEVKISGFSTLLVPTEDNKLVGIGYATKDNGYGGQMEAGVKLALFDVSDPSKPAVVDEKEFPDMISEAQYDHHALLQNNEKGYLAIPYEFDIMTDEIVVEDAEERKATDMPPEKPDRTGGGVLVFRTGDQIDIVEDHVIEGDAGIRRCICIDDYIYSVSDADEIIGFEMK